METKTFRTNLNCAKCAGKAEPFLKAEKSIQSWKVDISDSRKTLEVKGQKIDSGAVRAAVEKSGFEVFEELSGTAPAEQLPAPGLRTYFPLVLIFLYLVGGVGLLAYQSGDLSADTLMRNFMGGFFLVFSFFKLLNISAFADAYRSYDLVAAKVPAYGFVYPFLELGLGIAYLSHFEPVATNVFTLVLMGIGSLGVVHALQQKNRIECACLGTVFKLPMTKVTLFEDLLMVAMAGLMLLPR